MSEHAAGHVGRPKHPAEIRLRRLLAEALDVVYRDLRGLVEACSELDRDGEALVPREGTLDPDARQDADELLDLIRRIEAEGVPVSGGHPAWLTDIARYRREP